MLRDAALRAAPQHEAKNDRRAGFYPNCSFIQSALCERQR